MHIQEPCSTQTKQPEEDKEETMFSWKAAVTGFKGSCLNVYGWIFQRLITTTKAISQEQRTEEMKIFVFLKRNGRLFRCCNIEKSTKIVKRVKQSTVKSLSKKLFFDPLFLLYENRIVYNDGISLSIVSKNMNFQIEEILISFSNCLII
ncbi:hypothetical protein ISN44_As08g002860 [Arabidopsis suecica]|uniref:Uncharacterized protein n=1 Tax=Arabidopsis suecica TaxID=45249 RepID=A0A8T2B3G6_ARASU|nr:hypothetical protein ISN44_As08g002860 [Arabidopsis suecica]